MPQGILRHRLLNALLIFMLIGVTAPAAHAGIVGTDTLLHEQSVKDERQRLTELLEGMLERDDVRAALVERGVSPEDAAQRVASLSEQELQAFGAQMDELPAGAGAVTLLLVIILLILILR